MNYEDEIFNFLTKEENFKGVIKAVEHLPEIKRRLVSDLWEKVYDILTAHYKEKDDGIWEVFLDRNIKKKDRKLHVTLRAYPRVKWEFPPIAIAWENLSSHPLVGFFINLGETEKYDCQKFHDTFIKENIDKFQEWEGPEGWWPLWNYEKDFTNSDISYTHILPDNLEAKANEMAQVTIDLQEKLKEHFITFEEIYKK